ncbi:tetratricopeptide repeat protein [Fibrella sp. USSR17]
MLRCLLFFCLLIGSKIAVGQGNSGNPIPVRQTRYFSPEVIRPGAKISGQPENEFFKTYSSWATLAERSRQTDIPITLSLTLDSTSRRGDWTSLRNVQHVRQLNLQFATPLTQALADSLSRSLANWPELVFMNVSTVMPPKSTGKETMPAIDGRRGAQLTALTTVTLSFDQLAASLQWLSRCPSVKTLTISGGIGSGPYALPLELRQLTQLESLTLYGNMEGEDFEKAMSGLTNLKVLQLYTSGAGKQVASIVKQLPNLRRLHLRVEPQKGGFTGLRLGQLAHLDTLYLDGAQGTSIAIDSVLAGVTSLKMVDLTRCGRTSLNWLANNPDLRRVRLAGCRVLPTEKSLANLTQLQSLAIEYPDSLSQFPASIPTLPGLLDLRIDGSSITALPASIGAMTSLTALSINGSKLRALPAEIGNLTALRMVAISGTSIESLPASFAQLTNLTDLYLASNKLTSLPPGLGRLRLLRNLNVTQNRLITLPADIGQCRALTSLSLDVNPLLASLPASIGELKSLTMLGLQKTRLSALPATLGNLTELNRLSVSGGQLSSLPESLGSCQKLQFLSIADSTLAVLPASFSNLKNLETLTLDLPQLRLLPAGITDFSRLRMINLVMPQLVVLPEELGKLSNLANMSVKSSKLLGLPTSIGRLAKLEYFVLDGGVEPITNKSLGMLEQLPDSLARCGKLRILSIRNQLAFDGADAIRKITSLPDLTSLQLDHCGIDRLTDIDWKTVKLRQLSMSQNSLRDVPEAILDAPQLEQVNLSYNYPLPKALNQNFWNKEMLRTAFTEARLASGSLPTDKPDARIMQAYMNAAMRQVQQRNWGETFANFDKAVLVAPDSLKALPFAQRAELYLFRKEYALAVADLENAISFAPKLKRSAMINNMSINMVVMDRQATMIAQWWGRLGTARLALGQYEKALADLDKAISLLPSEENSAIRATFYIERGKASASLDRTAAAKASLSKANEVYTAMVAASPGERLTEVELAILTNQPEKATAALAQYRKYFAKDGLMGKPGNTFGMNLGGYTTLQEYLATCIAVINGSQTPEQAQTSLTTYLKASPERIYNWSFDLFETMLPRIGLPADKVAALSALTKLTKEQAVKVE